MAYGLQIFASDGTTVRWDTSMIAGRLIDYGTASGTSPVVSVTGMSTDGTWEVSVDWETGGVNPVAGYTIQTNQFTINQTGTFHWWAWRTG